MSTISIVRNALSVEGVNPEDAFWTTFAGLKVEKNKRLSGSTDARSLAYNLMAIVEKVAEHKDFKDLPIVEALVDHHKAQLEAKDKAKDKATEYADRVEALIQSDNLVTTVTTEEAVKVADRIEKGKDNLKTLDKALDLFTPFEGGIVWNLPPKAKALARSFAVDGHYMIKDGNIYGQRDGDESSKLLAKEGQWERVEANMPQAPKGAPKA